MADKTRVSLGGNLPNSPQSNGLIALADDLAANSKQTITALVEIDVNYLKVDPRTRNVDVVTIQLSHIEPLTEGTQHYADAQHILDEAFSKRTGEAARNDRANQLDIEGTATTATADDAAVENAAPVKQTKAQKAAAELAAEPTEDALDDSVQ